MGRMRGIRLSLSVKYLILFSCAVTLIIAAALAVPWLRMRALVDQQQFLEAKRASDAYFRNVLIGSARGAAGANVHQFGLLDESQCRPFFVAVNINPDDPESLIRFQTDDEVLQRFVMKSAKAFATESKMPFRYRPPSTDRGRRFLYAHPIRASQQCLTCHAPEKSAPPYVEGQLVGQIVVDLSAEEVDKQMLFNMLVVVAAGLLAGILAILVFYVITHRFILSPIESLRQTALRVAGGDFSARAEVASGDEFEQLGGNLNNMLERLREGREELENANRALDLKVEQLAESNVALYESNRVKSEFLASVSHELRTPLTSIIGFAELLRDGQVDPKDKTARYSENILISGRILLDIINDLLDLARIEAGRVDLRIEEVDLRELCRELIDFARPMADKRDIELDLIAPGEARLIRTDRGRVRQILFNLLSNAVKFTREEGRVVLRLELAPDGGMRVSVTDTGPGIAPEHQALIFDKFRQIDQSATREHAGVGLGLAIARELATAVGGEITLESQIGTGSTFTLRLPPDARRATPEAAVESGKTGV
ncbi:MAG: HAMP domain-containing protein [Phycisphaerales bacterium]|nr:HAMP domain-containing protein [Phycisphaerales bacterium]